VSLFHTYMDARACAQISDDIHMLQKKLNEELGTEKGAQKRGTEKGAQKKGKV
jgi:hypothetical protein